MSLAIYSRHWTHVYHVDDNVYTNFSQKGLKQSNSYEHTSNPLQNGFIHPLNQYFLLGVPTIVLCLLIPFILQNSLNSPKFVVYLERFQFGPLLITHRGMSLLKPMKSISLTFQDIDSRPPSVIVYDGEEIRPSTTSLSSTHRFA